MWNKRLLFLTGLLALAACVSPNDPTADSYIPVVSTPQEDGATGERDTTFAMPDNPRKPDPTR
ncbi:MAG: hypothetical protein HYS40_02075 [Gemmatimonadetes bacterium]|nr:hypothetical protein [Gemmatimonadota bacterium]